jgi:excinuclease UvrABC ATPase subunit
VRETISVKGARVHNLQNIDVEIPRNQLVVITGVSGSGKSSMLKGSGAFSSRCRPTLAATSSSLRNQTSTWSWASRP